MDINNSLFQKSRLKKGELEMIFKVFHHKEIINV